MLRSEDFVTWPAAGAALVPPDPALGDYFSAPEVAVADGRFYLYYSVGRMNQVHQLRVAVSDRPLGPYEDTGQQLIDPFACYFSNDPHAFRDDAGGDQGPRVLASVPDQLLGPGHNSVVTGPDGSTDYLAYHAWDPWLRDRRMCLDRLRWTADGPRCDGPTWTAQRMD